MFFVRRLRLAHFLLYDNAAGLKRMKGKSKMFCTKCGAKLSDKAKFCTSCGEPVNNQTPEKQNKNSKLIWAAIVVVVILFIIIAACDDTGDVAGDNTTENTLQSEEIIVTDTPTSPEPDTDLTPTETTVESDESKYPKTYNDKGELIVYWLEGGSVWHESAKCGTVINAEASKLHSGTPYEAYSNGKERACKTCSSDSTVVITETTRTPDTTSIPETSHTPEITIVPEITKIPETTVVPDISTLPETTVTPETTEVPETTKTPETTVVPEITTAPETTLTPETAESPDSEYKVYWTDTGKVWHYSSACRSLDASYSINTGSVNSAYAAGMTRACKICGIGDETTTPESTIEPEITTAPETTTAPDTTNTPETTTVPETTSTPETTTELESDVTIYWIDAGYVWHYSKDCWTLSDTDKSSIHTGVPLDAYTAGMLRGCLICAGDSIDTPSEDITIISYPKTARRNETVSVTIQALPNTKYHIVVNYKSGPSKSKDLDEKISDANGIVTWTWKVGAKSAAGTFDIIVKDDDGKSVKVEWTVVVD